MGAVDGRKWEIRSDQNTIYTGLKFSRNLKLKMIQYMLDEIGRLLGSLSVFLTRIDFLMLSKQTLWKAQFEFSQMNLFGS